MYKFNQQVKSVQTVNKWREIRAVQCTLLPTVFCHEDMHIIVKFLTSTFLKLLDGYLFNVKLDYLFSIGSSVFKSAISWLISWIMCMSGPAIGSGHISSFANLTHAPLGSRI